MSADKKRLILPTLAVFAIALATAAAPLPARADVLSDSCTNNVDDDNDGVADNADTDCTQVNNFEGHANANGEFHGWLKAVPSADTRKIFVSSSTGNDSNNGLSASTPKRTLAGGYALLRHGYPDWLMLKRGDTFTEGFPTWRKAGRSATEMMVIGAYGPTSTPRPLLNANTTLLTTTNGGNTPFLQHLLFTDLQMVNAARDPNSPNFVPGPNGGVVGGPKAISWRANPANNVVFQGLLIKLYFDAITMEGNEDAPNVSNFKIKNSVIVDQYGVHDNNIEKSSGIYFSGTSGTVIENSVFDHNGYNDQLANAYANIFNHNIYVAAHNNSNVNILNNIIARASSHGTQLRSGGNVLDNLFYKNSTGLLMVTGGGVARNVFLNSKDISASALRGTALEAQMILSTGRGLIVQENIIKDDSTSETNSRAMLFDGTPCAENQSAGTDCAVNNTTIKANIVYNWHRPIELRGQPGVELKNVAVRRNVFKPITTGGYSVIHTKSFNTSQVSLSNNTYGTSLFEVNDQDINFSQWASLTQDVNSQVGVLPFADPNRTLAGYAASIGLPGTEEAFLNAVRNQQKGNWYPERYSATAVNAYIRAGFVLTQ